MLRIGDTLDELGVRFFFPTGVSLGAFWLELSGWTTVDVQRAVVSNDTVNDRDIE